MEFWGSRITLRIRENQRELHQACLTGITPLGIFSGARIGGGSAFCHAVSGLVDVVDVFLRVVVEFLFDPLSGGPLNFRAARSA